jgi:hypothetical protein
MSKIKDSDIIKKFIKLLENNLLFKGSPKGYSASTPYQKPTVTPPKGKSNYDLEDYMEEDDEEDQKKKVEVAKYFQKGEDEIDDDQ